MEKQSISRKFSFCFRFLKKILVLFIFLFLTNQAFSQRINSKIIRTLHLVPMSEVNYVGEACGFSLSIPYVKLNEFRTDLPPLQNGVSFISSKRTEYNSNNGGTIVEIWFSFSEAKTYKLNPLRVIINERTYYVPFDSVKVIEDPKNIRPKMIMSFEDGTVINNLTQSNININANENQKINFTISLQHAVQIVSFDYQIPKDSVLIEKERFDNTIINTKENLYDEALIPVASFEWLPLVYGSVNLPEIRIVATSYNGERIQLMFMQQKVNIIKSKDNFNNQKEESIYGYAFVEDSTQNIATKEKKIISIQDCQNIRDLRHKERNSFIFTKYKAQRKAYEETLGIFDSKNESSLYLFYTFLIILTLLLLLLIIFALFKNLQKVIITSSFVCVFIVITIISFVNVNKKHAIVVKEEIRNVPELSVDSISSIKIGTRVLVVRKASKWCFIQYGNSSGWILEEDLIFIN